MLYCLIHRLQKVQVLNMGSINCNTLSWKPEKEMKPVLNKVTLEFSEGGFYAVIGPNGSGKTSFLRHIMKFLPVQEGSIFIDEKDIDGYRRQELAKKTAFVPQNTFLDLRFTAYDIVMMGRNPYQKRFGGVTKEDIKKVEEALEMVSLEGLRNSRMSSLSGGEAQRVAAARAIAQDTPWLLLDEPAASLDIKHQMGLMEILKSLNTQKGTSIIIILHDMNLVSAYCKDIVMMKHGEVRYMGKKEEVFNVSNLEELYEVPFICIKHPLTGNDMFLPAEYR